MNLGQLVVERLEIYSEADAAGIGRLMPFLSEKLNDEPMDENILRDIIDSPHHDQLVGRIGGTIVGAATMNLNMGPGAGRKGYLEDFVVDPEVRGRGVSDEVWEEGILDWCKEQGINFLGFTSHPSREAAHRFYLKHGAEIRDTTVFHVKVPQD